MDEVAIAIHIEPLLDAVKELNERFAHMSMLMETKFEAVHRMEAKLQAYDRRSTSRSNCAFYAYEDNKDQHVTSRCCRYPDPVSHAIQASTRQLCEKCLQPRHREECGITCQICGRAHNVLLCPSRGGNHSFKRRKVGSFECCLLITANKFIISELSKPRPQLGDAVIGQPITVVPTPCRILLS
ncbi:hypothetical protein ANCCAN_08786 [Ancylostoma caninum]|uniref:Uncharacterized protein n=1 Tax=Ancylostoma caninum TaxID=29170 RepID=A0A368GLF7_ANCCA|nr:hypothetical protein ANCCAN_08786 [Ancylostoma caninum]